MGLLDREQVQKLWQSFCLLGPSSKQHVLALLFFRLLSYLVQRLGRGGQSYAHNQKQTHEQDCQNHVNSYNAAVVRQQQDNSGLFQSLGSTLSGISAQDYQRARIDAQYLNAN